MGKGDKQRVFVVELAGSGGISHYTYNLVQSMAAALEVSLYSGCPYELAHLPRDFELVCIFRRFKTNPLRVLSMYIDAMRKAPIAIHFQLSQFPMLVLVLAALFKLLGKRVVTTAHNVMSHELNGWSPWIFSALYGLSDGIVVHSEHSKSELVNLLHVAPERIAVIDHGNYMFFDGANAATRAQSGEVFRILFFGYIRKYKGLAVLLDALRDLADEGREFVLEIVGKPVESFAPYRQQIERCGLSGRVTARLDYVPLDEVQGYFQQASVVVLPYLEISQSGVLQLAYAFGKPVIATRTGGLPEVVEEGRTGFVVPPGDRPALAAALRRMIDDRRLLSEMGRQAKRMAETRFSWQQISERNRGLYANEMRPA